MFATSIVLSLLASRLVFAESGYPQWPKDCSIVKINNDKSRPGIGCQCEKADGSVVSCVAEFSTFLDNDQGTLKARRNGAASLTCSEWNLVGTYLAADCKGSAVALIDLGEICKNKNGELQCGQSQSSASSTAPSSPIMTSGQVSASASSSPSDVGDGSGSSQTALPIQTTISVPSPSTSAISTPSAMSTLSSTSSTSTASATSTTSSAASISTGSADSCGSYQKRMRIVRSNEM